MDEHETKFTVYRNEGGPDVAVASRGALQVDGKWFRDLAGTGELLPYEDWRLPDVERARDLASRMSVEEIAGLMMYSPHQMVPSLPGEPFQGTYDGHAFDAATDAPWDLTDQQRQILIDDGVRHVLAMKLEDAGVAAKWSNNLQALAESLPWGVPVNVSSDPRHGADESTAEFKGGGGGVSRWPEGIGMAATFEEDVVRAFGRAMSAEYRALGIATALGPQVDIATEPRWMRLEDTWGPNPAQVRDYAKALCDELQTTEGSEDGWGTGSVCAMAKHWPGGAPVEGGRDAHYPFGKFAVYPGDNFETHLTPFTEGAFKLDGPTGYAASVMPYYTVSWERDVKNRFNVGNSYSEYLIQDLLRDKYGYEGVVCTDWGITQDPEPVIDSFGSRCYGEETLTEAERHLLILENGVDQFGGNYDKRPILEAYRLGCEKHGEAWMRERMERSAVRLLTNMFRLGLFENPYLDVAASEATVGCEDFVSQGFDAQVRSVVMVKNDGALPVAGRKKVYIPSRHIDARKNFFRQDTPARDFEPPIKKAAQAYFDVVDDPAEADFALVAVESPLSDGYSDADAAAGGTGYVPISLQYRPYVAEDARATSIAGGDFREDFFNRSYRGKEGFAANERDLDNVIEAKRAMGDKPVVVALRMHNPCVLSELEPYADAILVDFGVQSAAILDLVGGKREPSGLLPADLPADMATVEAHSEDVPFDYEAYVDSAGNRYGYGFGLDWDGPINDERAGRWKRD